MIEPALVFDIETDSSDVSNANMKFFGGYSYKHNKYYFLKHDEIDEIKKLIKEHKVCIGFNIKGFDIPILEKLSISFEFKLVVDLYEISAPKGIGGFGYGNKDRLNKMGYKLKDYKLKTIIHALNLDDQNKGDIDYNIFKKDEWDTKEIKLIEEYTIQDIKLTKKLFDWFESQFKPLSELISSEDKRKLNYIRDNLTTLGYKVICHKSGLPYEFSDSKPNNNKSFSGGHHIHNRWDKVKGNIVSIDFTSAYPHALMMCNLFSPHTSGWDGANYYKVDGCYDDKKMGNVESSLKEIFLERLKAKKENDKPKNLSYKIIINSIYGLTGNYRFKSLYNPTTASDCTSIVRTWLKKLAKTLEINGFQILYGFTDNVYVKIPDQSNKNELLMVVDEYVSKIKKSVPFPMDTFGLEVEKEMKMMWFITKNCYLWVDKNDKVGYKSTLLNANTPKLIMNVFERYISKKIIKDLDVSFSKDELEKEIKKEIEKNISLCAQEYNVRDEDSYNVKTSIQYQISKKYGSGKHLLIANSKGVGVGSAKTTKNKIGVRYCTIEEFQKNKLTSQDVDISKLIEYLKKFITKEVSTQRRLAQ